MGTIINGFYEWAIVSDPNKLSLVVLARNVDDYVKEYERLVIFFVSVVYRFNDVGNRYVARSATHDRCPPYEF